MPTTPRQVTSPSPILQELIALGVVRMAADGKTPIVGNAAAPLVGYEEDPLTGGISLSNTGFNRSITIVGIGDSHTNGQIPVAVSGSDTLGTYALTSPRDKQWNGSGVNQYFRSDSQINSSTTPNNSNDTNLGVGTLTGTYLTHIPGLLRSGYPLAVGDVTIANLGVGGACAFSWAGEQAYTYVGGLLAPTANDTITIGGVVYTFVASAASAREVTISTATGSILNLANAINAEGTGFGAGTAANPNVYCPNPAASTYLRVQAKLTGSAGNSLTAAASNTTKVTALTPGLSPIASQALQGGSDTSAIYANGKTALSGGAGIGAVSAIVCTLGTNDANRVGYRGVGTLAELTKLVSAIKVDFPGTPIVFCKPIVTTSGAPGPTTLSGIVVPAIDAVVAANPGLVYAIDMYSLGAGSGNTLILQASGVHATAYGYSVMAQLFAAKLAEILHL